MIVVADHPPLKLGEFVREVAVRDEELPNANKGAHDRDVHPHGAGTVQNPGQHSHALFREGQREVLGMRPAL